MKGLFKGIKYISQIFVFKEHEMQIGYPTDVRHVAHIGWDGLTSTSSPSWMKEFRTSSSFSATSLGNFHQSRKTSWPSQDFNSPAQQISAEVVPEILCPEVARRAKKEKRKKTKSTSPSARPRSTVRSSKDKSSCATAAVVKNVIPEQILVA